MADTLLHPHPLRADQAIGIGRKAGELFRHRVEPFVVPEVDDRAVGERVLGNLGVVRQALGRRVGGARRVEFAVDLGVAVMRRVQRRRRLAADKIVDVAVRVGTPAPANQVRFELAL